MSVEQEEVAFAICDGCGERRMIELDDDTSVEEVLQAIGWEHRKPERQRFVGSFDRGHVMVYPQDFCADCQDGEPAPKPRFGARRRGRSLPIDVYASDPIDEWPRAAIWQAAGLRPACGHPGSGHPCAHCEAGYPIGRTDERWRR